VCFLLFLFLSAGELPARVATHFDISGRPDGWMSRTTAVVFSAVVGSLLSMFLMGLFFSLRFFPDRAFNLPRRDYWLAPERRAATFAYLFRQSFWLSSMMIAFLAGLQIAIIQANRPGAAPHLSMMLTLAVAGCLIAGHVVWIVGLFRHFMK
jgi:uncharacterized membrane protein